MTLNDLKNYLPENSLEKLHWKTRKLIQYKLAANRLTKWGYFKPGIDDQPHTISINVDLNQQAFLFTLIHEIAHARCWEEYGRKVKPHGKEWKEIFSSMLYEMLKVDAFDPALVKHLFKSIQNPKASCQASVELSKAFSKFDKTNELVFIDEIEKDRQFITQNGRAFKKGKRLRKRFKCKEIATGKWYLFSPIARVKVI